MTIKQICLLGMVRKEDAVLILCCYSLLQNSFRETRKHHFVVSLRYIAQHSTTKVNFDPHRFATREPMHSIASVKRMHVPKFGANLFTEGLFGNCVKYNSSEHFTGRHCVHRAAMSLVPWSVSVCVSRYALQKRPNRSRCRWEVAD